MTWISSAGAEGEEEAPRDDDREVMFVSPFFVGYSYCYRFGCSHCISDISECTKTWLCSATEKEASRSIGKLRSIEKSYKKTKEKREKRKFLPVALAYIALLPVEVSIVLSYLISFL